MAGPIAIRRTASLPLAQPGHPRLSWHALTWKPSIADNFTQPAQKQTAMAGHDELLALAAMMAQ
jgi:hypothetical protein